MAETSPAACCNTARSTREIDGRWCPLDSLPHGQHRAPKIAYEPHRPGPPRIDTGIRHLGQHTVVVVDRPAGENRAGLGCLGGARIDAVAR